MPVIGSYVRQVRQPNRTQLQIVVPKNFLSTERLKKNKQRAMNEARQEIYDFWLTKAGQKLNKTYKVYVDNLFVKTTGDKNLIFELGNPAAAIEKGYKSFDMKPGFAASSKLKLRKLKIPKAKRVELIAKKSAPTLIIPIDPQRGIFRTFSLNQMNTNLWQHPGYTGAQLIPEIKRHIKEVVIPKVFTKYVRDAFTK